MVSTTLPELWPAAGLRVRAGDLELRWIDDELLVELAELAGRGIHDPTAMPFAQPWTRGSATEVARNVLGYQWSARSRVGPDHLVLELGVLIDGQPVGVQSVAGTRWSILRELETGSWLGREFQGRGIGVRMRALMLRLCFEGLGADQITSTAFVDNGASNAVSRRTGYESDGQRRLVRDGTAATQNRYRMTRERWLQVREANAALLGHAVIMDGLESLLGRLGADAQDR